MRPKHLVTLLVLLALVEDVSAHTSAGRWYCQRLRRSTPAGCPGQRRHGDLQLQRRITLTAPVANSGQFNINSSGQTVTIQRQPHSTSVLR